MTGPVKVLLLFVNESDTWQNRPLYQAIVERLLQLDVAGATATSGLMGFGHHHRVHHKGLFGVADDRPITIIAVEEERKLREIVPAIRPMVREGLLLLLDAELVADMTHD
jgi:PII-like signaling protein